MKKIFRNLEWKKLAIILLTFFITLSICSLALIYLLNSDFERPIQVMNIENINDIFNSISSNCEVDYLGIVKRNDNNWYLFKKVCNSDGYCKHVDIPINNCLKEEKK